MEDPAGVKRKFEGEEEDLQTTLQTTAKKLITMAMRGQAKAQELRTEEREMRAQAEAAERSNEMDKAKRYHEWASRRMAFAEEQDERAAKLTEEASKFLQFLRLPFHRLPDDRCKWLDEAAGMEPGTWATDTRLKFKTNILGDHNMGMTLVVRECFVKMGQNAEVWLTERQSNARAVTGFLVVTGTPGVGKSVFQGYMAARLAAGGFSIVVQCGAEWCSRRAGEPTVNHGKDKPLELLRDPMTVLLADPLGGGESECAVAYRGTGGCTIVFTSPRKRNYETAWKQGLVNAVRWYMPTWTKDELVAHRLEVLPLLKTDEEVETAFELLGGSLRWLVVLSRKKGTDMRKAAQQLVKQYVAAATYNDLLTACRVGAAGIEDVTKRSRLSYLLQINTNDYENPEVELLKSEAAVAAMREKLGENRRDGRAEFLNAAMEVPALGSLVGKLFQEEVLDKLTAKGKHPHTLQCKPLAGPGPVLEVRVPNQKQELQTAAAKEAKSAFSPATLYAPLSDTFPAADFFFFVREEGEAATLVLLQTTKDGTLPCKIGAMWGQLKHSFTDDSLSHIRDIKWVVLAPPAIAQQYSTEQLVRGPLPNMAVKQYVAEWTCNRE